MTDYISLQVGGSPFGGRPPGGQEFRQFKEVKVTRSLDAISGSFEFVAANSRISDFPFSIFETARVVVSGLNVINGYIYKMVPSYNETSHTVNITGFDKTRDLVDVSIFKNVQYNAPISLQRLAINVITDHEIVGMSVLDRTNGVEDFKEGQLLAGETGNTLFEYIDKHARKRNVLLSNDGNGNLVLYRNSGISTNLTLKNIFGKKQNSRIKSASAPYDYTKRFDKVIVKSQGEAGESDINGEAVDKEAKRGRGERNHVIISKTIEDNKAAQELAEWEVNKRRSDSIQYTCVVQGFSTNGVVWQPNQLVNIIDEYADFNSRMLLKSVVYSFSEGGSTSKLTFVGPDSYALQANDPKEKNKLGDNLS